MLLGEVTCKYGTSHSKIFLAFGPEERMSRLWFCGGGSRLDPGHRSRVRRKSTRARDGVAYDIEERTNGVVRSAFRYDTVPENPLPAWP
jgi:hypothetical protein